MDKILIVGTDTIVGGNMAAWLAPRYQVLGLSWGDAVAVEGCESAECDPQSLDAAQQWLASERPHWTVFCGVGSQSCWELPQLRLPDAHDIRLAGAWAKAAKDVGSEFSLISSDAVFTGPWLFHREASSHFCETPPAKMYRLIEKEVADNNEQALIARTNVFGWSPTLRSAGLVERIISGLEQDQPVALDCMRHATPILSTDFVEVLERAYQQRLQGLYHIAGAERVNPFRFACLLADLFQLPMQSLQALEPSMEQRRQFGAGETSLQTKRIRKVLDMPLPLIREGLHRLHDQYVSGYRDRFQIGSELLAEKVA